MGRLHVTLVVLVVVAMAAAGSVAEGLAAFGSYQDCPESGPPPPAQFVVWSTVIVLVCGLVPAACVGPRHGRAWLLALVAGLLVPLVVAVIIGARPQSGLCLVF
ncbi:MAG TPA: hypothetical protein VIJ54_02525 [Actinomycetes bacterium]